MNKKKQGSDLSSLGHLIPKLPKDVIQDMSHFLLRVFGPLAEGGEYLSDQIRFFRFRSAVKTLQLAKQLAEQSNIELNEVPIKFLVPFLENCSLEEEDSELIEQWARLLVSASADYEPRHSTFVNILSQIGSSEAKLMKRIYEQQKERGFDNFAALLDIYKEDTSAVYGQKTVSLDEAEAEEGRLLIMAGAGAVGEKLTRAWKIQGPGTNRTIQSLLVLERQNLIKIRTNIGSHIKSEREVYVVQAVLTPLGYDFVQACEDVPGER